MYTVGMSDEELREQVLTVLSGRRAIGVFNGELKTTEWFTFYVLSHKNYIANTIKKERDANDEAVARVINVLLLEGLIIGRKYKNSLYSASDYEYRLLDPRDIVRAKHDR